MHGRWGSPDAYIVSHRHKFIFLKTKKTASGTCELVLGRQCESEDLLVPTKDGLGIGVREQNNHRELHEIRPGEIRHGASRVLKRLKQGKRPKVKQEFNRARRIINNQHADALTVRNAVGTEIWQRYYRFCFERNPFDRLVSFYYWRVRLLDSDPEFAEFARAVISDDPARARVYRATGFSNRPYYEIYGELVVDRVYRYEHLEEDLKEVFGTIGLSWDGWLPHTKGNIRPERDYRAYYDRRLRSECEQKFAREIELFGYEF